MYNTHLDFLTFSDARSALCSASSVRLCAVVLGRSAEQWHTSLSAGLSCSGHSVSPSRTHFYISYPARCHAHFATPTTARFANNELRPRLKCMRQDGRGLPACRLIVLWNAINLNSAVILSENRKVKQDNRLSNLQSSSLPIIDDLMANLHSLVAIFEQRLI